MNGDSEHANEIERIVYSTGIYNVSVHAFTATDHHNRPSGGETVYVTYVFGNCDVWC